jgi:hypothetical protein
LPVILSYLREKSTYNPSNPDNFVEKRIEVMINTYIYVFIVFLIISENIFRHLLPPVKKVICTDNSYLNIIYEEYRMLKINVLFVVR